MVSPKSYRYSPCVSDGHEAGSTARNRVLLLPASFSRRNGKAMPLKFEPPPAQPITTSGWSPAMAICLIASCPITVW